MSRIGKLPVEIPEKVEITIGEDNTVVVKGPKGELTRRISDRVKVRVEDKQVVLERTSDLKADRALHGLSRALIANMVEGVSNGYSKKLQIIGIGYKAEMKGKKLTLNLGYSHPIVVSCPDNITLSAPTPTEVVVSGIDKELVGLVAAKIRSFRKPEPYKGKGVRYENEYVRRKAGKTAGK